MSTANGPRPRPMARFGSRDRCRWGGHPTARVAGSGSSLGAGTGWTTSPGDLRRVTTGAGLASTTAGAGCPASSSPRRFMRPHSSPLFRRQRSRCPCRSRSMQDRRSAGFRSRRARSIGPPIPATRPTYATSTSPTSTSLRSTRSSPRHRPPAIRLRRSSTSSSQTEPRQPWCRRGHSSSPSRRRRRRWRSRRKSFIRLLSP
jgi:hypothetical protein